MTERCKDGMCWAVPLSEALDDYKAIGDHYREALRSIINELGVPGPLTPAPIANAVQIATTALVEAWTEKALRQIPDESRGPRQTVAGFNAILDEYRRKP